MKTKLYIILALACILTSCDKSKTARSIYDNTPPTVYSMTPEEEAIRMKDVFGCYDLILGETSPKEAKKIMKNQNADFEGPFYRNGYKVYESYTDISSKLGNVSNFKFYRSEIKHSYEKFTYIYTLFVNDTLSQICLSFHDKSYYLEPDLIKKYGEGNGEKKDTQFGIKEDGSLNFYDIARGYEYRQWKNETTVIDWPEDRFLYNLSNSRVSWHPTAGVNNNTAIYTSKKMAPRILHYLQTAYDNYQSKKEEEKTNRINNL